MFIPKHQESKVDSLVTATDTEIRQQWKAYTHRSCAEYSHAWQPAESRDTMQLR